MTDGRQWQPAGDEAPHAVPVDAPGLAASRQRAMPEPPDAEPKQVQRWLIHGHPVVLGVSTHHRLQPFAYFRDGFMHTPLKFGFHRVQLRLQSLAYRLPQQRIHSVASLFHTDVREAEKVERLRLPFSASLPVVDREWTKFQQPRLFGMQLQVGGLCRPSVLAIYILRTGFARYAPRFSLSERSWRLFSSSSP